LGSVARAGVKNVRFHWVQRMVSEVAWGSAVDMVMEPTSATMMVVVMRDLMLATLWGLV
jgi:hypothetical protein